MTGTVTGSVTGTATDTVTVTGWQVRLDVAQAWLTPLCTAVWAPAGLADRYRRYLAVMHGVVRASVPLMESAIRRCAGLPGDPVADRLAEHLRHHVDEELDHDDWLLDDLALAGGDPDAVRAAAPTAAVARLVGAQYYWLEHHHPVCLLGYIAVLEGAAPPPWLPDRLSAATGLPPAAFRTLRHHAVVDDGHAAQVRDVLHALPLTPRSAAAVGLSVLATAEAFATLLADLCADHGPEGARP